MILVGSATGIGLLLPLTMAFLGAAVFPINMVEGAVALAVMFLGVGIRVWAARTLGRTILAVYLYRILVEEQMLVR